jgi:ribosomal protein S18 acetylase RimI-like enzyme
VTNRPTVVIRSRTDADLPALGRVLAAVHERDGYPVEGVADPVAWLTSDRLLGAWVAEINGEPIGHVALTRPGGDDDAVRLWIERTGTDVDSIAVLGRLFLGSEVRGQRLGQHLTSTATQAARAHGRRAVLDVMAKDAAAIRIYESLGWQRIGTITHQYGDGQTEPALAYASPAD